FGIHLTDRGFRDRRAIEVHELDEILFLLALCGGLERLLERLAHVDRPLDVFPRTAPWHQWTPTVAGSPASKATSPSANTGPSRQTRALPSAVTTTQARHTPIAHPMCCSTAICASSSVRRPGNVAAAFSAFSRRRPSAASIAHGPQARS